MQPTSIQCELITWDSVHQLTYELAVQLSESGYRPDMIVAVARGGYVPARLLCDFLGIYDLSSVRVEHYAAGAQKRQAARLKFPLSADVSGRRVVIIDDVCDSGDTYHVALKHIAELGPRDVKTAALHHKQQASYTPDYVAREIHHWRWLIYPWAVTEDIGGFLRDMENRPRSAHAIAQRLQAEHGIQISEQRLLEIFRLTGPPAADQ